MSKEDNKQEIKNIITPIKFLIPNHSPPLQPSPPHPSSPLLLLLTLPALLLLPPVPLPFFLPNSAQSGSVCGSARGASTTRITRGNATGPSCSPGQNRRPTLPQGWPKAFLDRYLKSAFTLTPAATGASLLRGRFSRPLLAIMVIVALVLLVASANLANLALARAAWVLAGVRT